MAGIVAYGAYVPLHRLGPGTIGWKAAGEKAIASFDEDSLTMGVAAATDCLKASGRDNIDGVYFATTTAPYDEKLGSTLIALAADLRRNVYTADIGHSLRGSTIALKAALDAVKAGSLKNALVVASDLRIPPPGSSAETEYGDGAAAVVVGNDGVCVEVEGSVSVADELLDQWRPHGETFVRSSEDRFSVEVGYLKVLPEAVRALLQQANLQPKDIAKVVFNGPNARRLQQAVTSLGFDAKTQLQDPLYTAVGNTGTAEALMSLIGALEQAKAGDRILLAAYGNGADALLLKVTGNIDSAKGKTRLPELIASKQTMSDYTKYAKWRGLMPAAGGPRRPAPMVPSTPALKREEAQVLRLRAQRCKECGTIQYPEQRVCTNCYAKDGFEQVRLADKKATLFTYSMDHLATILEPPQIVGIIDFEGGGRMMAAMTDRDISKVSVGMPLEMTFRRLITVDGINNYYWKCMPVRGA